jgi:hypothetical protein
MPTFDEYYSYWEKEAMRIKQDEERRKNHEREEFEKIFKGKRYIIQEKNE